MTELRYRCTPEEIAAVDAEVVRRRKATGAHVSRTHILREGVQIVLSRAEGPEGYLGRLKALEAVQGAKESGETPLYEIGAAS